MNKQHKSKKNYAFLVIILPLFIMGIVIACNSFVNSRNSNKKNTHPISHNSSLQQEQNLLNKWNLILVNPSNSLPEDFKVKLTKLSNGHSIDERVYPDLQQMMDDARSEGLHPIICSSYRSNNKQQSLFNKEVDRYITDGHTQESAKVQAAMWVAIPGTSEHQTGLAVDIVAKSYQMLDKEQENTKEQQWLMENSYKYGFILRYPSDKSEITGINYEPWHYRYVGKKEAKEIYEKNICLEEYLSFKTTNNTYTYENLLVNYNNSIPKDYTVDLIEMYDKLGGTIKISKDIYQSLKNLIAEAEKNNINLCINSAYRSYDEQKVLFDEKFNEYISDGIDKDLAIEKTKDWVALPGKSEHETGLAIDFGVFKETTWDEGYGWLEKNAHNFGFIYRYPKNKEDITKVSNEPWHYRFVGIDVANYIHKNDLCLEEYLNK